jgi:hypothetical protein
MPIISVTARFQGVHTFLHFAVSTPLLGSSTWVILVR